MLPLSVIVKPVASPSMTACSSATAGFSERSSAFVPRPMRSTLPRTCVRASPRPEARWMTKLIEPLPTAAHAPLPGNLDGGGTPPGQPPRRRRSGGSRHSPRDPPVIKHRHDMHDREQQQQDRERNVDVEPELEDVLVALLINETDQQLFALPRGDEKLAKLLLLIFLHEAEQVCPVRRLRLSAAHAHDQQAPSRQPPRRSLANELVVNALKWRRFPRGDARHLLAL